MKYCSKTLFFLIFTIFTFQKLYALQIMPDIVDFGKVKKFHQAKRYILFSNNSQDTIEILGIINACGIALKLDKKLLKPKEVTEGFLFFDSGNPQGNFQEHIKIFYKEGGKIQESKILVLWYTYPEKYPEAIVEKKDVFLGEILPKTPVPFEILIKNTGNMVLTISGETKEGFLLNLPLNIEPGEHKLLKGSLVVEHPEKSSKTLILKTNDMSNPEIILTIHYDAKWDVKRGVNFYLDRVKKTNTGYEIPIKIFSKEYNITDIFFEDINGKRLNLKGENRILLEGDEEVYIINLTEKEYDDLKKGLLYIKIGIPVKN